MRHGKFANNIAHKTGMTSFLNSLLILEYLLTKFSATRNKGYAIHVSLKLVVEWSNIVTDSLLHSFFIFHTYKSLGHDLLSIGFDYKEVLKWFLTTINDIDQELIKNGFLCLFTKTNRYWLNPKLYTMVQWFNCRLKGHWVVINSGRLVLHCIFRENLQSKSANFVAFWGHKVAIQLQFWKITKFNSCQYFILQ